MTNTNGQTLCAICGKVKDTRYMRWYFLSGREQLACDVHQGFLQAEDQGYVWPGSGAPVASPS